MFLCQKKGMKQLSFRLAALLFAVPVMALSQNDLSTGAGTEPGLRHINGFVRGGFYSNLDDNDKISIPSIYSDLGIKVETGDGSRYRAYADFRYRYGSEFGENVNKPELREAYVSFMGKAWELNAGQKIIKWGRADFTNPTQKLSPGNLISRSTDKEDIDLGNLLLQGRWFPARTLSIEGVIIPLYRPSVLLIKPIELPSYVTINSDESLVTSRTMLSYGLKADFRLSRIDFSFSWFDGYDPMPGIKLSEFTLDTSGYIPSISAEMTMTPYKIRNAGFDFETTFGDFGLRGEAAWTIPHLSSDVSEYVPLEEIKWALGADWMKGNLRITAEYSGKTLPGFKPSPVEPFIGTELDPLLLAQMMAVPGFDLREYMRQQTGAFNRLYNYQLEEWYHSAAIRIEADLAYGKLTPSLTGLYNFTSHDLMIMPELSWKPSDGLTIVIGGDFLSGKKGSLYDLADEFMNCFKAGLKVSF